MANHFPGLPSGLSLKTVTYIMNFGTSVTQVIPALQFTGVTTTLFGALNSLGNQGGVQFNFNTAGAAGSFDQDAAEAELTQIAGAVFQLIAALTGQSVASLAANFSVSRQWNWVDPSGSSATYMDTMPFTVSSTGGITAGTEQAG